MNIVEMLQRRGAYHGRLRQAVEDGTIFQMTVDGSDVFDAPATEKCNAEANDDKRQGRTTHVDTTHFQ